MKTKVALTFDVENPKLCPFAVNNILKILKKYNIKTTFFISGDLSEQCPDTPVRILSNGHEIGCHGYKHNRPYDKKSLTNVRTDVEKGTRILRQFGEVVSFRAPYFRPHKGLSPILESFGYHFDSSVPAQRFDLFVGKTSKFDAIFAPRKPYHPSRNNVFRKGYSDLLEIPLSCFVFPLMGVTLRNFGLMFFTYLLNVAKSLSNIIVLDFHLWEFVQVPATRYPHKRRRGKELWIMFNELLYNFKHNNYALIPICKLLEV